MNQPPARVQELRFVALPSGARLAWTRTGRPAAPVLVRVAHWMTHIEHDAVSPLWSPWIERIGRRLQFVRYDERGCGRSGSDDVPLGLETSVEELAAVVDALGPAPVALLGASGAAATAIAYAARYPTRVSKLVLLGGYAVGTLAASPSAETRSYFDAVQQLIRLGWGRNDPGVQAYFSSRFLPQASRAELDALVEQQRLSCSGERAAAISLARAHLDVRALLPQLKVPTLVLHSDGDLAVPHSSGLALAAAIPGARFETLRSSNHLPPASDPAFGRLADAIDEFIQPAQRLPQLTTREGELAALVARGLDNQQIAAHMGLAEKTVRNMLGGLYTKLGAESRAMAVVRARDLGL